MAGVWHPTIDAYEVHGSRQENWNDTNPQITVTLSVDSVSLATFVRDVVEDRPRWPECYAVSGISYTPSYLCASNIEILPVLDRNYTGGATDEIISRAPENRALVRVTYTSPIEGKVTLTTTVGTGTATGSGYQTQEVWRSIQKIVSTEFLTMDYNDFTWYYPNPAGGSPISDPLKPDEAPGKYLRTIKYIYTFKNVYLTEDLEDIINRFSGTVNNSYLAMGTNSGLITSFEEGQVLFNVEDIQPGLRKYVVHTDMYEQHYNLRVSFHCRTGLSTWNKYWRCRRSTSGTGGVDDSGWMQLYLKSAQSSPDIFEPYLATNYWYCLWV